MSCTAWEAGVLPLNYARALIGALSDKGFERNIRMRGDDALENKRRRVAARGTKTPRKTPRDVQALSASPLASGEAK